MMQDAQSFVGCYYESGQTQRNAQERRGKSERLKGALFRTGRRQDRAKEAPRRDHECSAVDSCSIDLVAQSSAVTAWVALL